MRIVWFLILFSILLIKTGGNRWQNHKRIWSLGNDQGTFSIPANGGAVITKEWNDGLPQSLNFNMRLPDSAYHGWEDGYFKSLDTTNFRYHAFLGTGQTMCAMSNPSFASLVEMCRTNPEEMKLIGPAAPQFVGRRGLQSFATTMNDIIDKQAREQDYEYQQACIIVTCYNTAGAVAGFGGNFYCPIELKTVSWRSSRLTSTGGGDMVSPYNSSDKTRWITYGFYAAVIVDVFMLLGILVATIRICSRLSESDY